ncbi:MAG: lipocalin-like domain-containing protein [Silvibacterium sp.]
MKARVCWVLAVVVALSGISLAQSAAKKDAGPGFDKEKLIGAWHLVSISVPGAGRRQNPAAEIKGTLIYTRDGHMSVQLMYPESASALSNDYVLNGYEASFGSYDVDEAAHTVTHHVQGSITHALVGKDLTRVYQYSDGHLIIKSANPDEHWQVVWEHY